MHTQVSALSITLWWCGCSYLIPDTLEMADASDSCAASTLMKASRAVAMWWCDMMVRVIRVM